MNRKRVREDILTNLDKLPEKFEDQCFYNIMTGCRCIYGWLAAVTGGPSKPDGESLEFSRQVTDYLTERYEVGSIEEGLEILVVADRIIRAHAPRAIEPWHTVQAPAMEVIQDFLAQEFPAEA